MQLSLRSADDIQDVLDAISEELNTGQFEQFTFEDPLLKVCLPVDRQIKCQHCPFAIILPGRKFTADWLMVQSGVVVQHRNLVEVLAEETCKKEYKVHFTLYGKKDIRDGVRHYQRFPGGDNWIHLQDVVHGGHPILGVQAFQDSTLVSSNGVSAKSCRISVLNVDLEVRCTTRPSIQRVCSCRTRIACIEGIRRM